VRPSRLTRLIPAAAVVGVTAAVAVPNLAAGQDDAGPDAARGDGRQAKNITWSVEPNSSKPNYVTDSASAAIAWSSGVRRTTPPSARTPAARSSRR
jgi:alkaline phosphatase